MPDLSELDRATIASALRYWLDADATDAPTALRFTFVNDQLGTLTADQLPALIAQFEAPPWALGYYVDGWAVPKIVWDCIAGASA